MYIFYLKEDLIFDARATQEPETAINARRPPAASPRRSHRAPTTLLHALLSSVAGAAAGAGQAAAEELAGSPHARSL